MVRCAFCAYEYKDLKTVADEFTKQVMIHVQATHPDKWKMVRPGDVWVVVVPDEKK